MMMQRHFFTVLLLATLLKLGLAAWLPLTGDEAYFFLWAKYPDFGYYDHPPMVGWWLHGLLYLGNAEWWLRLPAVLLATLIAWLIYRVLRVAHGEQIARFAGLLYLLMPVNLLNVFITTDTPLILFALLSVLALQRALQGSGYRWFVITGMLLGLAFLSKYFAVLLGLAYGVYLLLVRPSRRNVSGLLVIFLSVLPFAALNIWWNYNNCWNNILFNLQNRHVGAGFGWEFLLTYLLMMLYLISPPLLWYGWRERGRLWQLLRSRDLYVWLLLLPLLLFGLLSLSSRIGLHWVLAFYPLLFLFLPHILEASRWAGALRFTFWFSMAHLLLLVVVLVLPPESLNLRSSLQRDYVLGRYGDEVWQQIEPYQQGRILAADSYVTSAILEYRSGQRVAVFGEASSYARMDDWLTDYRAMDGRDLLIVNRSMAALKDHLPYFTDYRIEEIRLRGASRFLLLGNGFDYQRYHREILTPAREQYYRLPWFLPAGSCYFYQRYFDDQPMEHLPRS